MKELILGRSRQVTMRDIVCTRLITRRGRRGSTWNTGGRTQPPHSPFATRTTSSATLSRYVVRRRCGNSPRPSPQPTSSAACSQLALTPCNPNPVPGKRLLTLSHCQQNPVADPQTYHDTRLLPCPRPCICPIPIPACRRDVTRVEEHADGRRVPDSMRRAGGCAPSWTATCSARPAA